MTYEPVYKWPGAPVTPTTQVIRNDAPTDVSAMISPFCLFTESAGGVQDPVPSPPAGAVLQCIVHPPDETFWPVFWALKSRTASMMTRGPGAEGGGR